MTMRVSHAAGAAVIPERLALLDTITLDRGGHERFADGHCAVEVADWLAGGGTTSVALRAYLIHGNDAYDHERRQALKPYLPRVVGTLGDGLDGVRSHMALDWVVRVYTPTWLDLAGHTREAEALRAARQVVDRETAAAAAPAVADAALAARAGHDDRVGGGGADQAWVAAWAAVASSPLEAAWAAAYSHAWRSASDAHGLRAHIQPAVTARFCAYTAAADAADAACGYVDPADVLAPTLQLLHESALNLLDALIAPHTPVAVLV